jgi:hypothetical protein
MKWKYHEVKNDAPLSHSGIMAAAWYHLAWFGSLCCIGPTRRCWGLGSSSALLGFPRLDHRLALGAGPRCRWPARILRAAGARPAICAQPPAGVPQRSCSPAALGRGLLGLLGPALAARQEDSDGRTGTCSISTPILRRLIGKGAVAAAPRRRLTLSIESDELPAPPPMPSAPRSSASRPWRTSSPNSIDQVSIDYDSSQRAAGRDHPFLPRCHAAISERRRAVS